MRTAWLTAAIVIAIAIGVFLFTRKDRPSPTSPETPRAEGATDEDHFPPAPPLPGEQLMASYGDPFMDPLEDLKALDRVMSGFFSVVKEEEGFSIGGNEDLAAALRGENAYRQAFLPPDHRVFGPKGRLLDRWGTPLFVHPVAARRIELRAAGPDKTMFTDDDVLLEKPEP